MKPVKDYSVTKDVNELVKQMFDSGGFTAKNLGVGVEILEQMMKDKDCVKILSFPACIIATGTRGIIKELVKRKLVDVVITTCGTLDHDLARSWKDYYHGSFMMDDAELHKKGINRLGNVLVPNESYGLVLEDNLVPILKKIHAEGKQELATYELVWEIGTNLDNENSIIYWCAKNKIPMIIPGITDGAVGYQLWMFQQRNNFKINLFKDETLLNQLFWDSKKTGALIIGGGISKHHTIWWNQFRGGLDYAVYITTAVEWDGSLSGAQSREAVSWGKIKEEAKHVNIEGDATVILPLMINAVIERLKKD